MEIGHKVPQEESLKVEIWSPSTCIFIFCHISVKERVVLPTVITIWIHIFHGKHFNSGSERKNTQKEISRWDTKLPHGRNRAIKHQRLLKTVLPVGLGIFPKRLP